MTEPTPNQDPHETIKAEIGARVAAGQPFDDLLAMMNAPAPVETARPSKSKPTGKTRRAGQIVERGENKHLIRIYLGTYNGGEEDKNGQDLGEGKDGQDKKPGKRLYHNKTFRGIKKDAEKWLRGALRRLDMGEPIEESDQSFGAFFEEWLKGKAAGVKPSSHHKYRVIADCHLLPALKDRKLSSITPALVQTLFNDLAEKGLSGQTLTHVRAVLTGCLGKAVKLELMRRNPLDSIDTPRVKRPELQPITQEEGRALLKQARGNWYESLGVFLLNTGCRPGECLALKWSDVDLDRDGGTVAIRRTLAAIKDGKPVFDEPKTRNSIRTLPIGAELVRHLRDHRRKQNEVRLMAGPEWSDYGLVFTTEQGRPIWLNTFRCVFKDWVKAAGLRPEIRIYDCRHAVATWLISSGKNPKVASERLGHSGIGITLEHYTHVMPGQQKEATEQSRICFLADFSTLAHYSHTNKKKRSLP